MDSKAWKEKLHAAIRDVGTYRTAFDSIIDTLADILEQRDIAYSNYIEDGARPTVSHKSDRGSVNTVKNPKLQTWYDLNTLALSYWRDLGLTPAGLKRINESAIKGTEREPSALEKALMKLEKLE